MTRPRAAVTFAFLIFGLGFGLWAGASAMVLQACGVTPLAYGVALTLAMLANMAAQSCSGWLARHIPPRRLLMAALLATGAVLCAILLSLTAEALYAAVIVFGVTGGLLDNAVNAEGARVEAKLGRPILAGLHGAASLGVAVGAVSGSFAAARAGLLPVALFELAAFGAAALAVACMTPARPLSAARPARQYGEARFARPLVALGLVVGATTAGEAAANMWGASLLAQDAPQLAAIAGAGTSFFAACQATMRFCADGLRRRFDDFSIIAVSLAVAACGFALVALNSGFAVSLCGFAIIGLGAGAVVPCAYALALASSRLPAAAVLSGVSLFAGLLRVPGPLAMGALAQTLSIAAAFGLFALLFAAALLLLATMLKAREARA